MQMRLVIQHYGNWDPNVTITVTVGHWKSGQKVFDKALCEKIGVNAPFRTAKRWWMLDKKRILITEYKNKPEWKQRRMDIRKETLEMEDAFKKNEKKTNNSEKICVMSDGIRTCRMYNNPMKGHKRNSCAETVK